MEGDLDASSSAAPASLVGTIDIMVKQLFDIVYPSVEEIVETGVAGMTVFGLVVAVAANEDILSAVPEPVQKGGKVKPATKQSTQVISTPESVTSMPPSVKQESIWEQKSRILMQQLTNVKSGITEAEELLKKRFLFLNAPPPHLKSLVVGFMRNLGTFECHSGVPDDLQPSFKKMISINEAKQLCAVERKIAAFSYQGTGCAAGEFEISFYECDAEPKIDLKTTHHTTYISYPDVTGAYDVLEGETLQPYKKTSKLILKQAGSKIWGFTGDKQFCRGQVDRDRNVKMIVRAVTFTGKWNPKTGEIEGSCEKAKSLAGGVVEWEFRMEWKQRGEPVTQIDVLHVSEIFSNSTGTISVRYESLPPVTEYMHKEPRKPLLDFRMFYLSTNLQDIAGCGEWMSGIPVGNYNVNHSQLSKLLVDVAQLSPSYVGSTEINSDATTEMLITPRPPVEQSPNSKSHTNRCSVVATSSTVKVNLSHNDVTALRRMNAAANHVVNPRSIPPWGIQPSKELGLSQSRPLWAAIETVTFVNKKTLSMSKAHPTEVSATAGVDKIFVATPSEIDFGSDFSLGCIYEIPFVLINKDTVSRRLNITPPREGSQFSLVAITTPPPNGLVAPGLSLKFVVKFEPNILKTYSEKLIVATEWSQFGIPISAIRRAPKLKLETNIDTGACYVGGSTHSSVEVVNKGGWGKFTIILNEKSDSDVAIVSPMVFELSTEESINLVIKISVVHQGKQSISATILCDDDGTSPIELVLVASAHFPSISLDCSNDIDSLEVPYTFPLTSINGVTTKNITYKNNSVVPLLCRWMAESADAGDNVFTVDGEYEREFELKPGIELESTISFKPCEEGNFDGRIVLAAVGIPKPKCEDHPFWNRELWRLPKLEAFDAADPSGLFSKTTRISSPPLVQDSSDVYTIASYRLTGASTTVEIELIPSRLDSHVPIYLDSVKQRNFKIVNHSNDRSLPFSIDQKTDCAIPGMLHVMRGATITFEPHTGEVPASGSVTVNLQYIQHIVGDIETDVEIDFKECGITVLPITSTGIPPSISVNPKLLSLVNDGMISTLLQRSVEQRVTLTNTSETTLVYHVYYYPDHVRMDALEDPSMFVPLFRFDSSFQILQPKETRQATISLTPPSDPCQISESVTVVAASPVSACSVVLEEITINDLLTLRDMLTVNELSHGSIDPTSIAECIAILVSCVPPNIDTLLQLIDTEPEAVLHHMKMFDVSRRGLGLRSSQSVRGGVAVCARPTAVHSSIISLLENSKSLQKLVQSASDSHSQPSALTAHPGLQKIAMWTSIVSSFVLSMKQSKQSITVEAEVQKVKCHLQPSIIKFDEIHCSVPTSTTVKLTNVSGLDAMFTWGVLGVEEGALITADPPSGFLSAGATVSISIQLTVSERKSLDLVIPCAIREANIQDAPNTLLAVNVVADSVRSLSVSLSVMSQPPPCYFKHLMNTILSKALQEVTPLYVPSINFGVIPLFKSSEKLLRLRSHEGGDSGFHCHVEHYPASSLKRTNSAIDLVKKGKTAIVLQKEIKRGFMSVTGKEKAAIKEKEQAFKSHSDNILAEGLGVAFEVLNPSGELGMHNYVDIPVVLYTDLPGTYSDTITIDVNGIDSAKVAVEATVKGQYLSLAETTPGLTLHRESGPPLVSFPTNLASSQERVRQFYVTNESNVDLELRWRVAHHNDVGHVDITETGEVVIRPSDSSPQDIEVLPVSTVVPSRGGHLFKINIVMSEPGILNAVIVCESRSAKTNRNNARFLRIGSNLDDVYEERWKQESTHAIPLEIDVVATAVESRVVPDPSMLKLNCRGAPGPFNPKKDGFIRPITLSNSGLATLDFRVEIESPFMLIGFSLRQGDTPNIHTVSDNIESLLFQLRSGDALELTVQLPWEGRQQGSLAGTNGGYSSTVGSPHRQRGRVATTDISRTNRTLRVLFPHDTVQEIPVLAVVTYPAVVSSSNFLEFGARPEDRNASCSKRIFLKSTTSAPAKYVIVHSVKNRPLTKQTIGDVRSVPIVTMLHKESKKQLSGVGSPPIDDPSVFIFDSLCGVVPGVESSTNKSITDIPQVAIVIKFNPRGNSTFESSFRIEVEGGRGCEITLRGHAVLNEYGTIADQCKVISEVR